MAEVSGLDMVREIIGQINNLRRLVTINGKKFKWDGKKYVRAVDGKTFTKKELVSFVKDEKFTAPKTPKATKGELKVDGKTVYKKRDVIGDLKSKAKGLKSNALKIKNKGNQALQNAKLRIMQPGGEGLIGRRQRSLNKRIGKGGIAVPIIDAVIDKTRLPDRTANFFTNMMAGQNMNLAQRDAFNATQMAKRNKTKANPEDIREDQLANFLKTQKTNPIENSLNEKDIREDQLLNFLENQKTSPIKETPPNANTDTSKVTRETNPSQAKEKVKINPNAPDMGYDTKTSKKKKSKKSEEQIAWEKKSKNSPARKSGAFTDKELWEQYKKHQKWLKKKNRLKVRN